MNFEYKLIGVVQVPSTASLFYKVTPGFPVALTSSVEFSLIQLSNVDESIVDKSIKESHEVKESRQIPFDITPKTGVVYVSDPHLLFTSEKRKHPLRIKWIIRAGDDVSTLQDDAVVMQGITELEVFVVDANIESNSSSNASLHWSKGVDGGKVVEFCAERDSRKNCEASIGVGSPRGFCTWLSFSSNVTPTCTPDTATCPDHTCDELEARHETCPQDCWRECHYNFTYRLDP